MAKIEGDFLIDLYDRNEPFLIIKRKSGVVYTNQTGGCYCNHPSVEGVAFPIYISEELVNEIENVVIEVDDPMYDKETIKFIYDTIDTELQYTLQGSGYVATVDRTCKQEEAWITLNFVKVAEPSNDNFLCKLDSFVGILTYPNSD